MERLFINRITIANTMKFVKRFITVITEAPGCACDFTGFLNKDEYITQHSTSYNVHKCLNEGNYQIKW